MPPSNTSRSRLIAAVSSPASNRTKVASVSPGLATGHGVTGAKPSAEGRHEVWGLPGVHDVDLHALTDQGEQRGKGLIEGQGRWIVAEATWGSYRSRPSRSDAWPISAAQRLRGL